MQTIWGSTQMTAHMTASRYATYKIYMKLKIRINSLTKVRFFGRGRRDYRFGTCAATLKITIRTRTVPRKTIRN